LPRPTFASLKTALKNPIRKTVAAKTKKPTAPLGGWVVGVLIQCD